ncbi:MAG: hypothetical protein WD941_07945 [Opitutus sp.]
MEYLESLKRESCCEHVKFPGQTPPLITRMNTDEANSHRCSSVKFMAESAWGFAYLDQRRKILQETIGVFGKIITPDGLPGRVGHPVAPVGVLDQSFQDIREGDCCAGSCVVKDLPVYSIPYKVGKTGEL